MKKAFCFLLAIIFVCCVVVHGEDKRFSLEVMITNLTNFEEVPTLKDITDCWTMDYYDDSDLGFGSSPEMTRIYYEEYDGDEEILEFFDVVRGFFRRLFRSIKIVCEIFITVFDNLKYLLPWNSTVPRG